MPEYNHERVLTHSTSSGPNILVETWTYQRESPKRLSSLLEKIYTIEADPLNFGKTVNILLANVYPDFGKSEIILEKKVRIIRCPCVFYLDAYSCDNGGIMRGVDLKGKTALLEELNVMGYGCLTI